MGMVQESSRRGLSRALHTRGPGNAAARALSQDHNGKRTIPIPWDVMLDRVLDVPANADGTRVIPTDYVDGYGLKVGIWVQNQHWRRLCECAKSSCRLRRERLRSVGSTGGRVSSGGDEASAAMIWLHISIARSSARSGCLFPPYPQATEAQTGQVGL